MIAILATLCAGLSLTPESPEASALLERWGRLHHVRSALGLVAFLVALVGL